MVWLVGLDLGARSLAADGAGSDGGSDGPTAWSTPTGREGGRGAAASMLRCPTSRSNALLLASLLCTRVHVYGAAACEQGGAAAAASKVVNPPDLAEGGDNNNARAEDDDDDGDSESECELLALLASEADLACAA